MRFLLVFLLLFLSTEQLFAQINTEPVQEEKKRSGSSVLDDSTKQVYGPSTTRFRLENEIKNNNQKWYVLDTSIVDFHHHQFLAKSDNFAQNLGNIGTAFYPLFPEAPEVIGARLGFNVYDRFFPNPEEIEAYNTKSPFSRFGIIWGGDGRSQTDAEFTRNIDSRSNIGFQYRGLFIDKQIDRDRRGDRNVLGTYYNFHGNYATKDDKYYLSGSFSRNNHEVNEIGGVRVDETTLLPEQDSSFASYFDENRQVFLSDAETRELRTVYHVYQQYKFNDLIQAYHVYDRYKQFNDFRNTSNVRLETDSAFFGPVALDTIPVSDRAKIIHRQHEVGIKGDFGKTFYRFYYRGREVNHDYKFIDEEELDFRTYYMEHYGGFNLRFGNDSVSYISVDGEYATGAHYRLNAEIRNSWFYAKGNSTRHLPTYIQRAYLSRHNDWRNNFESTINSKIESGLNLSYNNLIVQPSVSYNLINNHVYFSQLDTPDSIRNIRPVQESGDISILRGDLKLSYRFLKKLVLSGHAVYTRVEGSGADAVRVPELFLNAQLKFVDLWADNLYVETGVDLHQRSAYFANAYDPSSMQFYVQDDFEINSFPIIDVFFNIRLNRGRAFLKYNNVLEIIRGTGYFLTPFYPGQESILDFGFDWILFD